MLQTAQAEVLRKQQEALAARQEAQKAAAAKTAAERAAAPRPPAYDANGSLVHLHGGKSQLDDILRQTGAVFLSTLWQTFVQWKPRRVCLQLWPVLMWSDVSAGDRQLVVLDFSASWCGPCRMMEPVLQGWARELGPKVVFVKCDAEAPGNRSLAASSGIR